MQSNIFIIKWKRIVLVHADKSDQSLFNMLVAFEPEKADLTDVCVWTYNQSTVYLQNPDKIAFRV